MKNLNVIVTNKIARYLQRDGEIVCGNSDYQITFTFDADWEGYETKTARFIWNGKHMDIPFSGSVCQVPKITNANSVAVGVYAGDISTTTAAVIPCVRSIRCTETKMYEGNPEVCRDQAIDAAERAEAAAAESGKAVAKALAKMTTQEAGNNPTIVMSQKAVTELVADALGNDAPTYETVDSVDQMTDTTKQYVLRSTGTVWAYTTKEVYVVHNAYDADTAMFNKRIASDGTPENTNFSTFNGAVLLDLVKQDYDFDNCFVTIDGVDNLASIWTDAYIYFGVLYYDSAKNVIATASSSQLWGGWTQQRPANDSSTPFRFKPFETSNGTIVETIKNTAYVRLYVCLKHQEAISADDCKDLIVEFENKSGNQMVSAWEDTGLTPSTSGGNYVTLLTKVNENAAQIHELDKRVTAIESESGTVTIPSYWEETVAEKTEAVKALQSAGGKDCVCFAWAADTHIPDQSGGWTTHLGRLMAKMLNDCEIPFAVLSGDIGTQASFSTEAQLIETQKEIPKHLAPLWGTERLLMTLGNHDGTWGEGSESNLGGYYSKRLSKERIWQLYFRGQALDFRRVFSDDGSYFYVDNKAQKTRFIVLNSHFAADYTDEVKVHSISCYGQEQLDWLSDVALDMPSGYGAVIVAHVPPYVIREEKNAYTVDYQLLNGIINAYNNKTTFSGSYAAGVDGWSNSTVSVDFTDAEGEIIAMFVGHIHEDTIDTTTLSCPILTIVSAGSTNEGAALERKKDRDTETSFDVVVINKATRTIYCTRVGAGDDREINY